MFSWSIRSK